MSNFWVRTLAGIAFLVVMVFGLIWDRTLFGALFVLVLWIALQEFYRMALGVRFLFQQKLGLVAGAAAFLLVACHCFYGWDLRWLMLALIPLLLIPVTAIFLPETGGKDHATVLHACTTVSDLMATDKVFRKYVSDIRSMVAPASN